MAERSHFSLSDCLARTKELLAETHDRIRSSDATIRNSSAHRRVPLASGSKSLATRRGSKELRYIRSDVVSESVGLVGSGPEGAGDGAPR